MRNSGLTERSEKARRPRRIWKLPTEARADVRAGGGEAFELTHDIDHADRGRGLGGHRSSLRGGSTFRGGSSLCGGMTETELLEDFAEETHGSSFLFQVNDMNQGC